MTVVKHLKYPRPSTCLGISPGVARQSARGPRQSPRAKDELEMLSMRMDDYEEIFTTPPVFFEADRLREDCQLLSLELRDEVGKREEAEIMRERVRANMAVMRAQLEDERSRRMEAETVMHDLLRAVKKANDVNTGLKLQRDAAIIAAMEPGKHRLVEEFIPEEIPICKSRSSNSRVRNLRNMSPNKLKRWSRQVEKKVDPSEYLFVEKESGDAKCVVSVTKRKVPKAQQVFLQMEKQSYFHERNDFWDRE